MTGRKQILTKEAAEKKMRRMAFEIVERNFDEELIVLAGIRDNGYSIALILENMLNKIFKGRLEMLGITLNKKSPSEITLDKEIELASACIIITDDVANSGRTMLYAIKPFLDHHPKKIQTLALVERTHKAFPVSTNYSGISLATTLQDHIQVEVENGIVTGAWLV